MPRRRKVHQVEQEVTQEQVETAQAAANEEPIAVALPESEQPTGQRKVFINVFTKLEQGYPVASANFEIEQIPSVALNQVSQVAAPGSLNAAFELTREQFNLIREFTGW